MQTLKGREVSFCDCLEDCLEHDVVVGVGKQVMMQHHVDPDLRVFKQFGGKRLLLA